MNKEEANEKILEIMKKVKVLSQEEIQLFKELIFKCDLRLQNDNDLTPLLYALANNRTQGLNLNEEQFNYLIQNSDLTQQNNVSSSPLMIALTNNKDQNLNLNVKQLDYLIKNSDLTQQNYIEYTALMYALYYNTTKNLNLSEEQIDYLIKNSDLKQQNYIEYTALLYALTNNKEQNLKLTIKQFQKMYDALDEEQKQTTFQKIIEENIYNNKYLEEINILLYDCKFKPNQEKINWLKENKNILKIIEKRDLLYSLENYLNNKEKNNQQNRNKIKI